MPTTAAISDHLKARLGEDIAALAKTLPKLAPLSRLNLENPLQGMMDEAFSVAVAGFKQSGINGYQAETLFRDYFHQGRIGKIDLDAALTGFPELNVDAKLFDSDDCPLLRRDLFQAALLYDFSPLTCPELNWQLNENRALDVLPRDLPQPVRQKLMSANVPESAICRELWQAIKAKLGITQSDDPAEPQDTPAKPGDDLTLQDFTRELLAAELATIGITGTLPEFIRKLTGVDILNSVQPQLNRICASALTEGIAAWHLPGQPELGLYSAWRKIARFDADPFLYELPDWQTIMGELPEQALDAIIVQLRHLEIPEANWSDYLRMLALESLGWASFIHWHQTTGTANRYKPVELADLLAIRLTLERLWLNQICRETWLIEGKLSRLQAYFGKSPAEFVVRRKLFQGWLPEHCTGQAEILTTLSGSARHDAEHWQQLALQILALERGPNADLLPPILANRGWRLFRLCQYLGLNAETVNQLDPAQLTGVLNVMDELSSQLRGEIWLLAYEHHYRDTLLETIKGQTLHQRLLLKPRVEAQAVFCMDIREEGIRRHLEALNPAVETWGAGGFPKIEITAAARKKPQPALLLKLDLNLCRSTLAALPGMLLSAPFYLLRLLAQFTVARHLQAIAQILGAHNRAATFNLQSAISMKDMEQLAGFFHTLGLTENFAGLVVLVGHRSTGTNQIHRSGYGCCVCTTRDASGMRQLAGLLNRPEVRSKLAELGVSIPPGVWFTAAIHDTCRDTLDWHDAALIPAAQQAVYERLQQNFSEALGLNALERYRQSSETAGKLDAKGALILMLEKSADFSQNRPESGHAGLATVIIGRRRLTKSIDLSRRAALVSYDPANDADGITLSGHFSMLESALLPLSLNLYFSVADPERLGSGYTTNLNLLGANGAISGSSGDLRLGLPREMVAGHEAMRLHVIVEGDPVLVQTVLGRHERLNTWLNNQWFHLVVIAPFTGEMNCWQPGSGFVAWLPALPTKPDAFTPGSEHTPSPPEQPGRVALNSTYAA